MHSELEDTLVPLSASVREVMERIEANERRVALVVGEGRVLKGVVTDGDIRRGILKGHPLDGPVTAVMNASPTVAAPEDDQRTLIRLMKERRLQHIPVVDGNGIVRGLEVLDDLLVPKSRPNRAIVLAGGLGTRLRPLTESRPKPLLPVGQKPILQTIVESLVDSGLRRIYLSVNYKASMIERHFGTGEQWGAEIRYLREDRRLGTAGPLSLVPEALDESVLVMNSDLLTTLDFGRLLDYHDEQAAAATMCVRGHTLKVPYGVIDVDDCAIVGIREKPSQRFFINAGIYVLEPAAVKVVPEETFFDMPTLFETLIDDGWPVSAFPVQEYWIDIGRHEDLQAAQEDYREVFPVHAR